MSAPRITPWKDPGIWPKLIRDPYASSFVEAPLREMDEEGGCRLLFRGEEVIALSSEGIALDKQGSMMIYLILGERRNKSFIVHGGQDEIEWLLDSIEP